MAVLTIQVSFTKVYSHIPRVLTYCTSPLPSFGAYIRACTNDLWHCWKFGTHV